MFENKKILVIGGSSGIGAEVVQRLINHKARVEVWSRSAPDAEIKEAVHWQSVNVLESLEGQVGEPEDSLDGLVYAPGSITLGAFTRLEPEQFQADFDLNVLGAVRVLQHTFKALRKSGSASVVLYSTVATRIGLSYHTSIAAAKAAVEGLSGSLAAEYANKGIRFNVIAPSLTDTPLAAQLLDSDKKRERGADRHPLGRVGEPSDIAAATLFLLSDDSSWMSGHVMPIEGGLSSLKP